MVTKVPVPSLIPSTMRYAPSLYVDKAARNQRAVAAQDYLSRGREELLALDLIPHRPHAVFFRTVADEPHAALLHHA
jgi:hypothetical protein